MQPILDMANDWMPSFVLQHAKGCAENKLSHDVETEP